VSTGTAIGLGLALLSTTLTNIAYLREHDAAAELPILSLRRPVHSVRLLLGDRSWMLGFAMESSGFLLYVAALAVAPLTLVQTVAAGGIGVLAFASAHFSIRRLGRRERVGVAASVIGLAALAISLAGSSGKAGSGAIGPILIWLGATAGVALALVALGRRIGTAAADGAAGGLFFSIGDISTKLTTQGGAHLAFAVPLIGGYVLGTALLQIGYQAGGALTVAGIATLLTNALPIAAGTVVLGEPIPHGVLGALRVLAFAAVVLGAMLLARPQKPSARSAEPG
jgi:hypothetical protein